MRYPGSIPAAGGSLRAGQSDAAGGRDERLRERDVGSARSVDWQPASLLLGQRVVALNLDVEHAIGDVLADGSGRRLAFYQLGTSGKGAVTFDLWTVPITVDADALKAGKPEPFVVSDAFEFFPAFSPDGRWIAHVSLEEGTYEIYVRQYPDGGRKWRVSDQG